MTTMEELPQLLNDVTDDLNGALEDAQEARLSNSKSKRSYKRIYKKGLRA
jgi:hypothetical protein